MESQSSLRRVLDKVTDVHRNDIKEFSTGHLNEGNLYLPAQSNGARSWNSSKKPAVWLRRKEELKNHPVRRGDVPLSDKVTSNMTKKLTEFASGPTAPLLCERRPISKLTNSSTTEDNTEIESDVLDVVKDRIPKMNLKDIRLDSLEEKQTKIIFPTKKKQYNQLRHESANVIEYTGRGEDVAFKSIANIERRLNKSLYKLEQQGISANVPSFYRLQAYSDCWEHLIKYSTEHEYSLKQIKDSYDNYVNVLLDSQVSSKLSLHDNIHLLDTDSDEVRKQVKQAQENVERNKLQVMEKLRHNERLRAELAKENELDTIELENTKNKYNESRVDFGEKKPKDLSEQVQELHAKIEDQLYEIQRLRKDEKESHVPLAVCYRLEQCLKETEVDIQKLCKQNEYLEQSIEQMEGELEDMLVKTGVKEKDVRLLWKKVNTSRYFPEASPE